jgi:hypothetical protein
MLTVAQVVVGPSPSSATSKPANSSITSTSWSNDITNMIRNLEHLHDRYWAAHALFRITLLHLRMTQTNWTNDSIISTLLSSCVWVIGEFGNGLCTSSIHSSHSALVFDAIPPLRLVNLLIGILHAMDQLPVSIVLSTLTALMKCYHQLHSSRWYAYPPFLLISARLTFCWLFTAK